MEKKSIFRAASLAVLMSGCALALTGCGGGEDEGGTTTVGKVMFPTLFGAIPSPGDGRKEAEALKQSGVEPLATKCGEKFTKDAAGNLLLTSSATFVVLIDVNSRDLEAAKALGFVEADQKYMSSVGEVFQCESRSI